MTRCAKVTKQMRTETAHRLNDHAGRCQFIHGHSYLWEVSILGPIQKDTGMVLDFSLLKMVMADVIDPFDHALVLQTHNDQDDEVAQSVEVSYLAKRLLLVDYRPTAENMAWDVAEKIKAQITFLDCQVFVKVWETTSSYAEVVV